MIATMGEGMEGELMTTDVAGDVLGLKTDTVTRAIRAGKLEGRKLGRSWFVTPAAVEAYRQEHVGRKGWDKRRRRLAESEARHG